jgi:hypothetical protein
MFTGGRQGVDIRLSHVVKEGCVTHGKVFQRRLREASPVRSAQHYHKTVLPTISEGLVEHKLRGDLDGLVPDP